jgi:FkbM family methyltransferase
LDLLAAAVRWLPSSWRSRGRDWIETRFRGTPPGLLKYRASELKIDLDFVLSHYRVTHPEVFYLQIGAFDGIAGDPIYPLIERHSLHGILLEPQKDVFARLTANYARFMDFKLINAAIAEHDGERPLFRVKPEAQGPEWLHQIASFDRKVIEWHAPMVPNLDAMIETEMVRCITFDTLFNELGRSTVDLLQIDAEGYDAEILRLFDVPHRSPPIVRFEHKHLKVADHEESVAMLVKQGYRVAACGSDTLAYRPLHGQTFLR